jgi:hypothetical protein
VTATQPCNTRRQLNNATTILALQSADQPYARITGPIRPLHSSCCHHAGQPWMCQHLCSSGPLARVLLLQGMECRVAPLAPPGECLEPHCLPLQCGSSACLYSVPVQSGSPVPACSSARCRHAVSTQGLHQAWLHGTGIAGRSAAARLGAAPPVVTVTPVSMASNTKGCTICQPHQSPGSTGT